MNPIFLDTLEAGPHKTAASEEDRAHLLDRAFGFKPCISGRDPLRGFPRVFSKCKSTDVVPLKCIVGQSI